MSLTVSLMRRTLPARLIRSVSSRASSVAQDRLGEREGRTQRHPLPPALPDGDALEDVLLGLGLDARDADQRVRPRQFLQALHRVHARPLVEQLRRLRPDAVDAHHLHDARRDLFAQLFQVLHGTALKILLDLARQVLSDARDLLQAFARGHCCDVLRQPLHGLGRAPVGPDAEGILALDLQEIGDLVEQ